MPLTRIEVYYPMDRGPLALRGSLSPMSWTTSLAPVEVMNNRHLFEVELAADELLEFKPIRDERIWAGGRNFTVSAGQSAQLMPYFERSSGSLEEIQTLASPELGREIRFRVFLPPSYQEHCDKRYPVLYAQDAQALFSGLPDPSDGHSWEIDTTLNQLYELGAIEELLLVGVYTDQGRLEMLSPSRDPSYGGGAGPRYRDFLEHTLKPHIDARYRTRCEPDSTVLIGSSMGGLFSFFAAWTRAAVFGKAACLSSSFWWHGRALVQEVQKGVCPLPRPKLYIDSGAARSAFEEDANLRDGYHHTVALRSALVSHCYVPGDNLHTLAFAGSSHNNASWAARVAIPLQLLFPRHC